MSRIDYEVSLHWLSGNGGDYEDSAAAGCMPLISVCPRAGRFLPIPTRHRARIKHLERQVIRNLDGRSVMRSRQQGAACVYQLLEQGGRVVLRSIDQHAAR